MVKAKSKLSLLSIARFRNLLLEVVAYLRPRFVSIDPVG